MKKYPCLLLVCIFITSLVFILSLPVNSQQCIDFQCHSISLPLYLKMLNFFDRHYNYKHLVKVIVAGARSDEEKVMKILKWTCNNIKRLPQGLAVIDDHIWYTIVRGYAVDDQFSDIFTTLCNHAGIKAFFKKVYPKDGRKIIVFSYAKNKDGWSVFDPYNGVYFQDRQGGFCRAEAIGSNKCRAVGVKGKQEPDIDYAPYYEDIPIKENVGLSRANVQSPLNRLLFELNKLKK